MTQTAYVPYSLPFGVLFKTSSRILQPPDSFLSLERCMGQTSRAAGDRLLRPLCVWADGSMPAAERQSHPEEALSS